MKLDIDTEVFGIYITGNVGVQVVDVDYSASGFSTSTGPDQFTKAVAVSGGATYTDVLPTLNLSFEVAEDQLIRAARSKVISCPRLTDFHPNT